MSNIRVREKHKSPITLNDSDYLSGGEGRVFTIGTTAYKIYHDSSKVLPEGKIQELNPIIGDNVLGPISLLYDAKTDTPIGFTMKYVSNTIALTQLFTTSFRTRYNVTPKMSVDLVQKMVEITQQIHEKKILIIDGNEFNYLVDEKTLINPYFIDVDSYQTKSYPAKVLMPSVKDWHSKQFSELSDWFSFAIIATQIYIGIHPYKGTHPDYNKKDMELRMKNNISIFNPKVSLPPAARSFDLIPDDFRNWLIDVLEKGKRIVPPLLIVGNIKKPQIKKIYKNTKFDITLHKSYTENLLGYEIIDGIEIIYTVDHIKFKNNIISNSSKTIGIIKPIVTSNLLLVDIIDNKLSIKNPITNEELCKNQFYSQKKLIIDNRIYIMNDGKISEIKLTQLGTNIIPSYGNSWDVLPKSTHIFRGLFYSDVLGSPYLYIPYDTNKMGIFNINELKNYKILDAKYDNNVCIILASKKDGTTDRIIIKFKFDSNQYQIDIEPDITPYSINFVTLENGISVLLTGDDSIEVFHKSFSSTKTIIENAGLDGSSILFKNLNKVGFLLNNNIYNFQMRK